MSSIITGTGSHVPEKVVKNEDFLSLKFIDKSGKPLEKRNEDIIEKMQQITGIRERRYAKPEQNTVDIASFAAKAALEDSGMTGKELDALIVAHNFGNIVNGSAQSQLVPNLAARVKKRLQISNPRCIAFDTLFGCPGWVQGMVQAHRMIQTGDAENVMVIGVDVLSRILDPNDLDVMLFGDGAGATVVSKGNGEEAGILNHLTFSHCAEEVDYIYMDIQNDPEGNEYRMKMNGRNVYKYAVSILPELIKECLETEHVNYKEISKFLFHQANEKMNTSIGERLAKIHDSPFDPQRYPMTIQCLGNTSVATIPTMLDLILKGELDDHEIKQGDYVVFGAVGAGMHSNCIVYKF